MPKRSPYEVLGVEIDASGATIKAAWRRLARQHHPDTTAGDAAAARAATRQMAEINAAYEELRDPARRRAAADRARGQTSRPTAGSRAAGTDAEGADSADATPRRGGGPPRPRPGRPVTARLDMTDTYTPRNQTVTNGHRSHYGRSAAPPPRNGPEPREAPRASDPTGPLRRSRMRHFRPPPPPDLADALAMPVDFGKFHGHTLGEIAAFEPSYIDWLAGTITRDRELVVAARVIQDDLDARGIARIRRPAKQGASATP